MERSKDEIMSMEVRVGGVKQRKDRRQVVVASEGSERKERLVTGSVREKRHYRLRVVDWRVSGREREMTRVFGYVKIMYFPAILNLERFPSQEDSYGIISTLLELSCCEL